MSRIKCRMVTTAGLGAGLKVLGLLSGLGSGLGPGGTGAAGWGRKADTGSAAEEAQAGTSRPDFCHSICSRSQLSPTGCSSCDRMAAARCRGGQAEVCVTATNMSHMAGHLSPYQSITGRGGRRGRGAHKRQRGERGRGGVPVWAEAEAQREAQS